jgi:phage head maturation protease
LGDVCPETEVCALHGHDAQDVCGAVTAGELRVCERIEERRGFWVVDG